MPALLPGSTPVADAAPCPHAPRPLEQLGLCWNLTLGTTLGKTDAHHPLRHSTASHTEEKFLPGPLLPAKVHLMSLGS